jgi:tetraacyldisaccharide 4'-kinase
MPATYDTLWRRLITGQARGPFAALARLGLAFAAVFYSAAVRLRNKFYDWGIFRVHKLPVPVISVGNITVGGTGKTPFVELVCRKLLTLGRKPAILTRGYKAGPHGSDEALMLAEHLPNVPVIVNPDRVAGGRAAIEKHGADVLVMDDGFQHRRLHRDLDIVLGPGTEFGDVAEGLLPRGLLREPVRPAWERCRNGRGLQIETHPKIASLSPEQIGVSRPAGTDFVAAVRQPVDVLPCDGDATDAARPLDSLKGRRICALAGIGEPSGFFTMLRELGSEVVAERAFPDHHAFTADDIRRAAVDDSVELTVTTEKDWMRLRRLGADALKPILPLAVLRIKMSVAAGEENLDAALKRVLNG